MSDTTLPYLERVPRVASAAVPLVILLHGRAAEEKTIFSIEGLLDDRYHVIAIRGTSVSELGGYEWFHDPEVKSREIEDEAHFLDSERLLTSDIALHRARVQPGSLFLWGFSQGAAMSLMLGLRGVVKPRGVVPMGGFLPSPIKRWTEWDKSAEYLFVHGTNDEVLPPQSSLDAKAFLDSKGIRTEYKEYRGRHKMTLDSIRFIDEWIKSKADLA